MLIKRVSLSVIAFENFFRISTEGELKKLKKETVNRSFGLLFQLSINQSINQSLLIESIIDNIPSNLHPHRV